ncbi:MAG TPA: hypothetical protein VFA85_18630 [Terriglobales bacterium]|nr:hypothetical protein [Terriglobales bacterium]
MTTLTVTNLESVIEERLRRFLQKWGRGRMGDVYNRICGPNFLVTREQFQQIAERLQEQDVLTLVDGATGRSIWLVRNDLVEQSLKEGQLR